MKLCLILVTLLDLFFSSSKAKQYLVETKGIYTKLAEVPGVERGNKKNRILYVIAGQRTGPNGLKFDACLLKLFAL